MKTARPGLEGAPPGPEIAERSGKSHHILCGFSEDLKKLGRQLNTSRNISDRVRKNISQGLNSLISRASSFTELDIPTRRKFPPTLLRKWKPTRLNISRGNMVYTECICCRSAAIVGSFTSPIPQ
ncbi:MAG: hypothetical protein V2I36_10740 [Desulfopila sp.]|jgi:hypothetical protein|nr:hypothetical protein [Desulfopila sp.]